MSKLALEGVRVADFTWWHAGPATTRVLANSGAQVIRVESTTQRDQIRDNPPYISPKAKELLISLHFSYSNPGKMSLTLNPKHPKGLEVARRLISVSDVVVDNMRWGVMERLGLGYEELVKVKPDIIVLNMPVMGPGGPHSHYGGMGGQISAAAGMDHLTGYPGSPPMAPGQVWPDFGSNPYHAATAVLAALHYRNRTGKGQHIILAQYESTVNAVGVAVMDYCVNGRVQERTGNRSPYGAPHGVYRCQGDDRWCAIAAFTDEEWEGMCRAMGEPDWSREERFGSVKGRMEHVDELDGLIEGWTSERKAEEVMTLLQGHGVAAGIVQTGRDLLDSDPQLEERGHYVYLDSPELGRMVFDSDPFHFSATPGWPMRPAPLLGEHNDYVCKEILGMSEDEINELIIGGVLE